MKLKLATLIALTSITVNATEISGKYVHESARYSNSGSGTTIGSPIVNGNDVFKSEHQLRLYVDGDIENSQFVPEGGSFHVEVQGFHDTQAGGTYDSNKNLTQREFLREAYIDTTKDDWSIRAGKQQVVWGKADGMKLLDMINPTDYSEMAQNSMEDSRIPVFMLNAEKTLEDGGSLQVILSQASENKFAGLMNTESGLRTYATNKSVDQGHPFILKGIDTITGKTQGFLNIAPDMMQFAANMGPFGTPLGIDFGKDADDDTTDLWQTTPFAYIFTKTDQSGGAGDGLEYYSQFVGFSTSTLAQDSAIMNTSGYSPTNPNAVFDLMGGTTAATMNVFGTAQGSEYRKHISNDKPENIALRFNDTTSGGTNYSFAFFRGKDVNPTVNVYWEDSSGNKLTTSSSYVTGASGATANNNSGKGGYVVTASGTTDRLVFEETNETITNLGAAFDHTVDSAMFGPVVIRAEGLYQKGVTSPVIDRGHLYIGDVANALKMEKGDRFKYVIGADITLLTNMMVSLQFIQDRNLDYVDQASTAVDAANNPAGTTLYTGHRRYTADMATMHITNNLNQAKKNKEFATIYLSKPFGSSGQHRWNNLLLHEEGGGNWNKFDVEYAIADDIVATGEINRYFGDENTQFGQLKDSSNVQLGLKVTF